MPTPIRGRGKIRLPSRPVTFAIAVGLISAAFFGTLAELDYLDYRSVPREAAQVVKINHGPDKAYCGKREITGEVVTFHVDSPRAGYPDEFQTVECPDTYAAGHRLRVARKDRSPRPDVMLGPYDSSTGPLTVAVLTGLAALVVALIWFTFRDGVTGRFGRPSGRHRSRQWRFISFGGPTADESTTDAFRQLNRAPFPERLRGLNIDGIDPAQLDAALIGHLLAWLNSGSLDDERRADLRRCLQDLGRLHGHLLSEEIDYFSPRHELAERALVASDQRSV